MSEQGAAETQAAATPSGSGIGVLIADADKSTRAFYNTALTKAGGFQVWTAATGKEAMDTLASVPAESLSVIVFDLTEGGLEGHLLLQKIRWEPKYVNVGVLVCSDRLSEEDVFLLREFDVRHFLKKSSGQTEFIEKIKEIDAEVKQMAPVRNKMRDLDLAIRAGNVDKCNEISSDAALAERMEKDPELVPYKAELHLLKREFDVAITLLSGFLHSEAKSGHSETFRSLSIFGKALCLANRFDEATGVFQRLAAKSPHNLMHKVNLGDALLGKGDVVGAEAQFKEVLAKDPENKDAQVGVGKAKLATGDTEGAISLFSKITGPIESYSLASYFNNAAVAMVRAGKTEEALELYRNGMQFFDKFRTLIYFNMGVAQLRMAKVVAACECFDYVIHNERPDFIESKVILREYRDNGLDHMITKYGNGKRDEYVL